MGSRDGGLGPRVLGVVSFALLLASCGGTAGSSGGGAGDSRAEPTTAEDEVRRRSCKGRDVPVPSAIDLGGVASAIAVGDLDGDGCRDVAAYVIHTTPDAEQSLYLRVAFGDVRATYARRWEVLLAEAQGVPEQPPVLSVRDTSDDAVAIVDVDGDGKADVLTAAGVARWTSRGLAWTPLPESSREALSPVRLFDLDGTGAKTIVRGTHAGEVERCSLGGACSLLPRAGADTFPVTDLVVGDFDHDGREDLLVGRHDEVHMDEQFFLHYRTWLYASRTAFATPVMIDGMHSVDLEVADLDGDGFPDVAAQVREAIPDFPSTTDLWVSKPTGFERRATLQNHDNHQDKAKLVDVDGDDCVDYLKIGVDFGVGIHWGRCAGRAVQYDERAVFVSGATGIGVQLFDLNGDGKGEIVVRPGVDGRPSLEVLPAPVKP